LHDGPGSVSDKDVSVDDVLDCIDDFVDGTDNNKGMVDKLVSFSLSVALTCSSIH